MNFTDLRFNGATLAAAVFAAFAAVTTAVNELPVWAMFVGWVAYVTGPMNLKGAAQSYICLTLGIAIGLAAALALKEITPTMGAYSLAPVVFIVASLVLSLRAAPPLNLVPAYWLGIIVFFAAHTEPRLASILKLSLISGFGIVIATIVHFLQMRILRR
ncbi:DUF1097 domain-containing protein [Microbulbifer elongatus]|uniref:DUF1097 domain-containing protein n=1 Tax=Microbulbifer elongatus TaxID=86173 RepID=UPI001E315A74|nr:DUF1097 domain-containing protein [Microbulbifer elongatus]